MNNEQLTNILISLKERYGNSEKELMDIAKEIANLKKEEERNIKRYFSDFAKEYNKINSKKEEYHIKDYQKYELLIEMLQIYYPNICEVKLFSDTYIMTDGEAI
jgi:pyruvate-formate lyase-activating enzyme